MKPWKASKDISFKNLSQFSLVGADFLDAPTILPESK